MSDKWDYKVRDLPDRFECKDCHEVYLDSSPEWVYVYPHICKKCAIKELEPNKEFYRREGYVYLADLLGLPPDSPESLYNRSAKELIQCWEKREKIPKRSKNV